jgi:hypothetical protein
MSRVAPPREDAREARVMSGDAWRQLVGVLGELEELVTGADVPDRPQDRAEGLRYLLRFLAAGIRVTIPAGDPDYPEFGRMVENGLSWGLDNPDCNYSWARIRGDATYRIGGDLGSACHLEFQVNTGHFGDGNVGGWRTVSSLNAREIERTADGRVEIVLSPERHAGNWLALDPEASFLLLRQYFNDWEREQPAELFLERVGAEYPAPLLSTDRIAARVDELVTWLTAGARSWANMSRLILSSEPNRVHLTPPLTGNAGLRGQSYGLGHFRCAPDEALLVEFEPPACLMWSVQLSGWYWESFDFASRQTSLNGSQAVLDADGVFRGVVAHRDPGVHNWIDTEGHDRGTIGIRFLFPDRVPEPRLRTVPFAEVARALPDESRRVTPEERREIIERRRRAVQLRYRY